jgi:beta-mannosidase
MSYTAILILFTTLIGLPKVNEVSVDPKSMKMEIHQGWEFTEVGKDDWRTAEVPGTVHTDLLRHELIPDPYFGINERNMQWIGHKNWTYRTRFNVDPSLLDNEHVEITFSGIDTYSEIYLNDSKILDTDNMFRTWKLDIKNWLKSGDNTLEVRFRNVFDENMPKWEQAPFRLMAFPNNDQADTMISMYSRKAQFHYGWDWGPRLVTYGVWKPVTIEAWSGYTLDDYHVFTTNVSEANATVKTNLEFRVTQAQELNATIRLNGAVFLSKRITVSEGQENIGLEFNLPNPTLWWTNGLGESYLYDYELVLQDSQGAVQTRSMRLGVRSLVVDRSSDSFGKKFAVVLNGVPVFMKGANHIPEDNFQNRVTRERYEHIMRSAADANMNMLRVWGGGIYEDNQFYELADEYGILIWQDMMFACAMYPGDENFLESVFHEVVDNVKRIRNHASLALYCGNNENEIAWWQWGWKQLYSEEIQKKYEADLHNLFYVTIPNALALADDTRYYLPSSPIAGFADRPSSDGDIHYWGVWHGQEPFEKYEDNLARFVSEYGFQSYPERSTIERFTDPIDRYLISDVMLSHQRCMADERRDKEYGNRLIQTYMDRMFRQPKDFNAYLYVSQLVQAEGMRIAIEAHRKAMPYTMGSLYWQINDCWPVASWSSIDYYGNWKATHHVARQVFEQVIIVPKVAEDSLQIHLVSDERTDLSDELEIGVVDFTTGLRRTISYQVVARSLTSEMVLSLPLDDILQGDAAAHTVLALRFGESKRFVYLLPPKELNLPLVSVGIQVEETETGSLIHLTSDKLAKNVMLELEQGALPVSDNYFDLMPGQKKTVSTTLAPANLMGLRAITLVDSY